MEFTLVSNKRAGEVIGGDDRESEVSYTDARGLVEDIIEMNIERYGKHPELMGTVCPSEHEDVRETTESNESGTEENTSQWFR